MTGWHEQQIIISPSGSREVQGQGLGRFSSWWALSSWFADVCFLTVLTWWRERSTIFLVLERTDPIMRAPPLQPHLNLITFKHHHLGFRASVSGRHQHSDGRSFPCSDVARFVAVCTFRLTLWLLTPHHSSSMALWDDPSSHFVFLFPGPEISHFPRISGSL